MTKIFCKIDGILAIFVVVTNDIDLARQTVVKGQKVKGAVLAVIK